VRFVLSHDNEIEGTTYRFTKEFDEEPTLEVLLPYFVEFMRGLGYPDDHIVDALESIAFEYKQL
jgi:hypothetical protein